MSGILCEHCTAVCCRYIALPIDTPEDRGDFDDIRWYLLHEGVSVFVEEGDWYICFQTRCRHLEADHRCGIYATRPRICRQYGTGECDYHSGDYNWEHHFTVPEHVDEYLLAHRSAGRRNGRAARPKGGAARGKGSRRRAKDVPPRRGNGRVAAARSTARPAAVRSAAGGLSLPVLPGDEISGPPTGGKSLSTGPRGR